MNIKALIKKYEAIECVVGIVSGKTILKTVLRDLKQLDEPETGHADEAPRYLKNILARLRELPLHNREVWLKVIMSEFKQDFSHAKWREGYEQGKFEGMVEREKVKVPQFVADWYLLHYHDFNNSIVNLCIRLEDSIDNNDFLKWISNTKDFIKILVNIHQFGYEVEEEERYLVKIKGDIKENTLVYGELLERYFFTKGFTLGNAIYYHTRKELEEAGFGWVFDCPGIEIEEVK